MEDIYGPIKQWDVLAVTSMHKPDAEFSKKGLFEEKLGFNSNIFTWNVRKVTDMAVSTFCNIMLVNTTHELILPFNFQFSSYYDSYTNLITT